MQINEVSIIIHLVKFYSQGSQKILNDFLYNFTLKTISAADFKNLQLLNLI